MLMGVTEFLWNKTQYFKIDAEAELNWIAVFQDNSVTVFVISAIKV